MPYYALWDSATNAVVDRCGAPGPDNLSPAGEGQQWHELGGDLQSRTLGLVDGEVTDIPLITAMGIKVERLNALDTRYALLVESDHSSCHTSQGWVQCNPGAVLNITAKVASATHALGAADAAWSIRWRRTDNSFTEAMSAAQMIAFAQEVESYVQSCDAAYWTHKDAISAAFAADSIEQLSAIDVSLGWPT